MRDTVELGLGRSARRGYHLSDIAIVPSRRTRDLDWVSTAWQIDAHGFELPLVAGQFEQSGRIPARQACLNAAGILHARLNSRMGFVPCEKGPAGRPLIGLRGP